MKRKILSILLSCMLIFSSVAGASVLAVINSASDEFTTDTIELKSEQKIDLSDPSHPVSDYSDIYFPKETGDILLEEAEAELPSSFDLSELGYVSSVKSQNTANLCWAFAGLASAESNYMMNNGKVEKDYSEQHIGYMSTLQAKDGTNPYGYKRGLNDYGQSRMVRDYLTRGSGLVLESDDPYNSYAFSGGTYITMSEMLSKPVDDYVSDLVLIPNKLLAGSAAAQRTLIKECVQNYGGVSMLFATPSGSSVDSGPNKGNTFTSAAYPGATDHFVTIIGWDDNYPKTNFRSDRMPSSNGAFKCKNSYGASWGQNGFFWLSYEDYYAGFDSWCVKKIVDRDTYSSMYLYDIFGMGASFSNVGQIYGANVFNKKSSVATETITAVAVYVYEANTTVSVYINEGNNKTPSTYLKTETFALPGYYTINLDTPVTVSQSQFTVGARYSKTSGSVLLPVEANDYGFTTQAVANQGESFYSNDGVSFVDSYGRGNVCIRALTGSATQALKVSNPSADKSGSVSKNTSVTWIAEASGGQGGYTYMYELYKNGSLLQTRAYSSSATATFTLADQGEYYVKVTAKDSSSATASKESIILTVTGDVATLSVSADKTGNAPPNTSVTWTAAATGTNVSGITYQFELYKNDAKIETRAYSSSATFTKTLADDGEYYVIVTAKYGSDTKTATSSKINIGTDTLEFTVYASKTGTVTAGSMQVLSISCKGGTAPYTITVKTYCNGVLVDEKNGQSYTYTLNNPGTYEFKISAVDSIGNTGSTETAKVIVPGGALAVSAVTANVTGETTTGTPVTWTAAANGGSGTYSSYKFTLYKDGAQYNTSTSSSNQYTYTLTEAGTYYVNVVVTDSASATAQADSANITVKSAVVTQAPVLSLSKTEYSVNAGTAVDMGYSVTGTPEPNVTIENQSSLPTGITLNTSSSKVVASSAVPAGTYTIQLKATNTAGADTKTITLKVNTLRLTASANVPSSISIGTETTLQLVGNGGTGDYLYSAYILKDGAIIDYISYSENSAYKFTFTEKGRYTLKVYVKDSSGIHVTNASSFEV